MNKISRPCSLGSLQNSTVLHWLKGSVFLRYLKLERDGSRQNVNHICKIIYLSVSQSIPVRHSVEIVVGTDPEKQRKIYLSPSHLQCLPPPSLLLAVTPGPAGLPLVWIVPSIIWNICVQKDFSSSALLPVLVVTNIVRVTTSIVPTWKLN